MSRSGASTVRVYDGAGTLIATIDPASRQRVPVAPPDPLEREIDDLKRLQMLKRTVHDLDPEVEESSDTFRVAVILITILTWTGDPVQIAAFTGFQPKLVDTCCTRWRDNGICDQDHVVAESIQKPLAADEEAERAEKAEGRSAITFWLCVLVALGHVRYDPTTDLWQSTGGGDRGGI